MAYQPNIPLASDQISVSQADLLGNFQEINTYTAVDHEAFAVADAGKHKKATFPVHAAPGPVGATEVGLYAATLSGNPELYINKTGSQIPFTAGLKAIPGWSYLPSGMIIQWGQANLNTAGVTIGYPIAFPTTCFIVQVSSYTNPSSGFGNGRYCLMADSNGVNSFKGYAIGPNGGNVANAPVFWFAIGY